MASYWIDGERWTPEGSFNEWQELLTAIYKELTPRKRGLQKILADGEELTSLMAGQTPAQTPDSYGRIDFTTLEVIQLAFQGLENGRTFIPNLQKILLGAAEFARLGDDQKKSEAISGALEGIKLLITLMVNLQNLYQLNFREIALDNGENISDALVRLNEILENLNDAQVRHDDIELADILEYRLSEEIVGFDRLFDALKAALLSRIGN